ncbi:AAA family ATPase, partial [Lactobacillus jensenii]|uniref:AAA family ATPase n=1 Tax=Lactobacillus jensenii TaxID=109790 RepID=UPI004046082D
LALSPKSNSAISAFDTALDGVRNKKIGSIPHHLKDRHYSGANKLGHGTDYLYPQNYTNDWIPRQYLPNSLIHDSYFN